VKSVIQALENKVNVQLHFSYFRVSIIKEQKANSYSWQKHSVFAIVGMEKRKYFPWLALSKNKDVLELPFKELFPALYLEKLSKKAFVQLEPPKKESRR
jgi:hypothetical protein